jgi:hypothetical protein
MTSPIRRGMTIELDEKGDQVFVDGRRYSRGMPGTLDSHVWAWTNAGIASHQATPEILEIDDDDDDDVEFIDDDDDDEVEYEGEIPRLSTRPPSLYSRIFSTPSRTPAPHVHRYSTARDLGKRWRMDQEREMSIVSSVGDDWPLASMYRIPSDRVQQVVREARSHRLYTRVIPRSRVVPVPVENHMSWIKEEYHEEDSGFFEEFEEGSSRRISNGSIRAGKRRERARDWEVILGTDEGAVEHLQRIVLSGQEEERRRESRRAIGYHPPSVASNPPPPPVTPTPAVAPPHPQPGTNWLNIPMAMIMGAFAMLYLLLKMPDD